MQGPPIPSIDDLPHAQRAIYEFFDDRLDLEDSTLGKAFPEDEYGSFLLGEVALFSFLILVGSGIFLGLLYRPGAEKVVYDGAAAQFNGESVPLAFASVLRISYDVPAGLFIRMVHHWAAYVFIAAIGLHMFRVFFTGAYRNPREFNWVIGASILFITLGEGFMGYALPFDDYGATATAIGFEIAGSIPVLGETIRGLIFGGAWPDNAGAILPRLFFYHVLALPLLIGGLLGAHMLLLVRQKHTEQQAARDAEDLAGVDGDDASRVVGVPLVPNQAAITAVVFLGVFGVIALLAGFFPVQRLPLWGPNDPTTTPAGVAPDWFITWVFGLLKLMGPIPYSEFIGGVVIPGLVSNVLVMWPFIDFSEEEAHFTADPIRRPAPTAVGVAGITFIMMLSIAAQNGTVATLAGVETGAVMWPLRILTAVVPAVWGLITYAVLRRGVRRREAAGPEDM
ncbi:MAG: cytochrome bc complex cytochrome b subunit [Halococcoides sp.]